ncbi:MAG TPA: hypothetical protein VHB51_01955 [Candidatus Saccharimonadales bacterium]|nr:hypothetical protein [Candidatus Saccharimonadales bacterium]
METPKFSLNLRALKRVVYAMAAALLFATGLPLLDSGKAFATTQLGTRSIQMSDSAVSGTSITSGVGSGTNVTYDVSVVITATTQSFVIDFCSNDPIIGDTCTAPAGMDVTGATLGATAVAGQVDQAHNWTITPVSTVGTTERLKFANDAAVGGGDDATAGTQSFEVSAIAANPSALGSFYARMYTYADNTWGTYTAPNGTGPGNYQDYGGFALSTTQAITITARVQETLTFCLTKADPNNWLNTTPNNPSGSAGDCSAGEVGAAANAPSVILGHGSPTAVLDANTVDIGNSSGASADNPIFSQLSTNATHGAVINLRNSNTSCGGLSADSGSTCAIPAIDQNVGSTCQSAETACAMTAGTAAFGLFINQYIPTSSIGTIGTITPSATYFNNLHCGADTANTPCPSGDGSTWFGMDSTTTAVNGGTPATNVGNVKTTYGSTVASSTGPVYHFDNEFEFAATAALTTPAGIYTANLSLIATGTF